MGFSTNDVQRKTGVKRHRLHTWILTGLFIPSSESKVAGGHGISSEYTRGDLYRIALLRKLIENGIHGKIAAAVINGQDFEAFHILHMQEKESARPGLILCLARRFKNGEAQEVDIWIEAPGDWPRRGLKAQLQGAVVNRFNDRHYDDVLLINLSKIIDEVESL
jgi:DNA-binding transcriptional MerR regulator